jgi:pimeloyl-ACP methyl ester carboxylesterase
MFLTIIVIILALLGAALIGPFLIPVPVLTGIVAEKELADIDSRFINVNGLDVHYKERGSGDRIFILLHGFGASLYSWREVMQPFALLGRVIAYDRPAFGLTSRPLAGSWSGDSPYSPEAQVSLLFALMDTLGVEKATLVGNSAGGTIALQAALERPERVSGLILVDAAVYAGGGSPTWLSPLLDMPQFNHLGPLLARQLQARGDDFIRTAWHDPSRVSAEILEGYRKPLRVNHWDSALWELTKASHPLGLPARLGELKKPTLVLTGDDDRIVPTGQSLRLAGEIPAAMLVVIKDSGHVSQEEKPAEFMQAVQGFIAGFN